MIRLAFLVFEQLRQTLLEPLQNLNICEVPLRKPRRRHNPQLRLHRAKMLRAITDHHNRLLHRAPRNLRRSINKFTRVELARARDAKQRGRRVRGGLGAPQREVRIVFGGGMRAVTQCHKRQQRPVVCFGGVDAWFGAEPEFDFGAAGELIVRFMCGLTLESLRIDARLGVALQLSLLDI